VSFLGILVFGVWLIGWESTIYISSFFLTFSIQLWSMSISYHSNKWIRPLSVLISKGISTVLETISLVLSFISPFFLLLSSENEGISLCMSSTLVKVASMGLYQPSIWKTYILGGFISKGIGGVTLENSGSFFFNGNEVWLVVEDGGNLIEYG